MSSIIKLIYHLEDTHVSVPVKYNAVKCVFSEIFNLENIVLLIRRIITRIPRLSSLRMF